MCCKTNIVSEKKIGTGQTRQESVCVHIYTHTHAYVLCCVCLCVCVRVYVGSLSRPELSSSSPNVAYLANSVPELKAVQGGARCRKCRIS